MSFDVVHQFRDALIKGADYSVPVAVIQSLSKLVQQSQAVTINQCAQELRHATDSLLQATSSCIGITAGCELYMKFMTRAIVDSNNDYDLFRNLLVERAKVFVERSVDSRLLLANNAQGFIHNGSTVMVHCHSRAVMNLLLQTAKRGIEFRVLVTEAKPTMKGGTTVEVLRHAGIKDAHLILDAAISYYMEQVDLCLVGAEGVVESGGIINQIGTFSMAVAAKGANKPFYVAVESYKFVRSFPLTQRDLPSSVSGNLLFRNERLENCNSNNGSTKELMISNHPTVDYTPPQYIRFLFTDLGILNPEDVSDELIKLYY